MILSQTLLFEPPGAHSRATGMSEWVPKVMGMLLGIAVAKVVYKPRVNVVDDGEGEADRPFFLLVGTTVGLKPDA